MAIDLASWKGEYLNAVKARFGGRVLFVGIQGSHGRGEAGEGSDIDMVLILDRVTVTDLEAYDEAISALPHRERICGFVSGREELACWSRADLFQFCRDTLPLLGDLRPLLPEIGRDDVRAAILTGACNLYHMCGHNLVHEKDPAILKGLLKAAVFVVQALHFDRTGVYVNRHRDLLAAVTGDERELVGAYSGSKAPGPGRDFEGLSGLLFTWAGRVVREYGRPA